MPRKSSPPADAGSADAAAKADERPMAATLRQRLAKPHEAAAATTTPPAKSAAAPESTSAARQAAVQTPSHGAPMLSPWRVLGLAAGSAVAVFISLALSLMFVQISTVDKFDLALTHERLRAVGMGEDWFPVWMSRLIVYTITEQRGGDDGGGGQQGGTAKGSSPAPPPPRAARETPSAPSPSKPTSPAGRRPSSTDPSSLLHCYTLEGYSAAFLQPHPSRSTPLFSCGTRVIDLRTEDRPEVHRACASDAAAAASAANSAVAHVSFATLRVVLTAREEQWHREVQPANTVAQRIPLHRVNDDYCDCLDGTDEMLTNACSMAGPLTPGAGGARWKSYLVSTQSVRLWEADDAVTQRDLEDRGYPLQPRKRGDVADRLYLSPGPVLPFVCTCGGVVRQLLAPSLLGDGIVDCCEGEDEAVLQGSPLVASATAAAAPTPASPDPAVAAAHTRALADVRTDMEAAWRARQATTAAALSHAATSADTSASASPSSYTSAVYPHHTSARALLVDMGYYSLFTAAEVVQERRAAARKMADLYRRGHALQRVRVEKGWEELGRHLVDNRTSLQLRIANVTREMEAIEKSVRQRMSEARANDPIAAGVPMEELQYHSHLMQTRAGMESEVQHMGLTTAHRAYGDHFEYYPLVHRILHITAEQLVDPSTPPHLSPRIAADRERRTLSPSQADRIAEDAYAAGQQMPALHVDNVSVSHYGIEVMRQTFVAQRFDPSEGLFIAQRLRLLPNNDPAAYTPNLLKGGETPFQRAPVLPTGSWQPYRSDRDARHMIVADPAGDVHLPWRAGVAAASPLYRGGGRLQMPTRYPEAPHLVNVPDAAEQHKSDKDRLKAAAEGAASTKDSQVYIPHHTHTPSLFAVNLYTGGVRCTPDALATAPSRLTRGQGSAAAAAASPSLGDLLHLRVAYLCHPKDRILHWAKNGKCAQEVIVGTPSACTAWALKVAKDRVAALSTTTA